MLIDLVCIQLSLLITCSFYTELSGGWQNILYLRIAVVAGMVHFFVVFMTSNYQNVMRQGYYKELVAVIQHTVLVTGSTVLCLYLMKCLQNYRRSIFLVNGILQILFCYTGHVLRKINLQKRRGLNRGSASVLLISRNESADEFVKLVLKNNLKEDIYICGIAILDASRIGGRIENIPIVADRESTTGYLQNHWVDEVFFNKDVLLNEKKAVDNIFDVCMEMGLTVHTQLVTENVMADYIVERFAGDIVLTYGLKLVSTKQLFLKRCMDIVGGMIGCILTGILYLILAPLIKRKSPGPAIFSQIRVGKNGKYFRIYKFRSMYMDAEERKKEFFAQNKMKDERMFKMTDDPRVIKGIGNFIRKTSLDEFPQFWNVLKGDMSLVGTRPPTKDEWEKYELHHKQRMSIKPGITGMWQVNGRSEITDFEEVVKLDTAYIMNWNLGMDIKILLKTLYVVIKRCGAE
ncbi:exopolysaccharide biosynthesis polyprenyl glycosylphosphotransferase [Marvinbryantia formatexigens DSM 14469]|uniref:Exopolysaccharide biosynthesis polyprenyl glycosylphosphotransferase n=2 Tax=Marvinbryantia TaxID=248744 RepID=C6LCS3_9FIRM|nr:exopolysaccharide biosynthesis polyprenyl glycosylphosphotransferase [Marvinbryantia formatexigens DSM 14469]